MNKKFLIIFLLLFGLIFPQVEVLAETEVKDIFFPTDRNVTFIDDFGQPRSGHTHEGTDLMGDKMTPLYAAVDGYISYIVIPEASWGYSLTIKANSDGYTYHYLHMNNDTPGTNDGQGGVENAYAPGLKRGSKVTAGQLVGWMGDSGNAEGIASHLHFEIRQPDKTAINAFPSLIKALDPDYDIQATLDSAPDINTDKSLVKNPEPANCVSSSVIKIADSDALYYCGADGKRYVFPNDKIYFSWFDDFKDVITLSLDEMAEIPLGGNVTYKPGAKMIKIKTDPRVYVVERGGVLRWVRSQGTAIVLYGDDWNSKIDDVPDSFFFDYTIGEDIL